MSGEGNTAGDPLAFLDQPLETPVVGDKGTEQAVVVQPDAGEKVNGDAPVEKVDGTALETPVVGDKDAKPDNSGHSVPLPTFLDMRDRATAAEKALKDAKPEPVTFTPPDPIKDPGGYARYQQTVLELNLTNERMNTSERFAVKEHGAELVDKARAYVIERMNADPAFEQKMVKHADPYAFAIDQYNDHIAYQEFLANRKAGGKNPPADGKGAHEKDSAQQQGSDKAPIAEQKRQPVVERKVRNQSITDETSAGGAHSVPTGGGQAFDSFFKQPGT